MKSILLNISIVGAGGFLGASGRYLAGMLVSAALHRPGFPAGTFVVNMIGCFGIGLAWSFLSRATSGEGWRLFLIVGVLGGFTTFSAFGYETLVLIQKSRMLLATVNVVGQIVLGLACVWVGMRIGST